MKLRESLLVAGLAAALFLPGSNLFAQGNGGGPGGGGNGGGRRGGRGNFDPAEFQQRRMEQLRTEMGVTDDSEWNAIKERIQKVFDAQQGMFGFRGGFGGGRRGGDAGGGGGGRGFGRFGQPSPESEALRTAIENNAPAEQIKAALEKYRTARKAKEDALAKAQADLQKVLSVKQEAVAVTNGLLN